MNFKRGKPKQQVRCTSCTTHRWRGNNAGRFKPKEEAHVEAGVEPTPELDASFLFRQPATKKTRRKKPWRLMVRWHLWPDRWRSWKRFTTKKRADQALAAMQKGLLRSRCDLKVTKVKL